MTALATVGTSAAACYRYTPIADLTPGRDADVRLVLTDAGAVALGPLIGNRIEAVDGRVTATPDTAIVLAVRTTTDRLGNEVSWNGEQVTVPRSAVARIESRSLDRRRSWLVGGLTTAAAVAIGLAFGTDGFGGGGRGGKGGTPQ